MYPVQSHNTRATNVCIEWPDTACPSVASSSARFARCVGPPYWLDTSVPHYRRRQGPPRPRSLKELCPSGDNKVLLYSNSKFYDLSLFYYAIIDMCLEYDI
jgi:hypothetical protein